MRKIELSEQAEKRLSEIMDYYLSRESVERTQKVVESFEASFNKIADNPFVFRKFFSTEFINLDIRICPHFNTYHIYFIVYDDRVRIAEIFHLKQSDEKLMLGL
ncbi:MAG TPA: type II toxin-antitoxin system RelE/ParE family toxin [Chitinophagaceae bacterium]|nr:type II toxin-antitoxin system RelE/ParE family toxin [Chitinophagaceae bacterium]